MYQYASAINLQFQNLFNSVPVFDFDAVIV